MALPGLHVAVTPINEEKAPTNVDLLKASEWRFEVAFGDKVVVKVSLVAFPMRTYIKRNISYFLARQSSLELSLYRISRIRSQDTKVLFTLGMAAASKLLANAKSIILLKRRR